MEKKWKKSLIIGFALLTVLCLAQSVSATNYTIDGYVTDNETGLPIPFVWVADNESYSWSLTDWFGYYNLSDNYPNGSYNISFFHPMFEPNWTEVVIADADALNTNVTLQIIRIPTPTPTATATATPTATPTPPPNFTANRTDVFDLAEKDGYVYLGVEREEWAGSIIKLHASNLTLVWETDTPYRIVALAVGSDDCVYAISDSIYYGVKLDPDGNELWNMTFGEAGYWLMDIALDSADNIYVISDVGTLKFNSSGSPITGVLNGFTGTTVITDGTDAYIAGYDSGWYGNCSKLNGTDLSVVWNTNNTTTDTDYWDITYNSGNLYLARYDASIMSLSASVGSELWLYSDPYLWYSTSMRIAANNDFVALIGHANEQMLTAVTDNSGTFNQYVTSDILHRGNAGDLTTSDYLYVCGIENSIGVLMFDLTPPAVPGATPTTSSAVTNSATQAMITFAMWLPLIALAIAVGIVINLFKGNALGVDWKFLSAVGMAFLVVEVILVVAIMVLEALP